MSSTHLLVVGRQTGGGAGPHGAAVLAVGVAAVAGDSALYARVGIALCVCACWVGRG